MPTEQIAYEARYVSISGVTGGTFDDSIIVSFYGVRGGFRSSENLTVEQAKELRDGLDKAIAALTP